MADPTHSPRLSALTGQPLSNDSHELQHELRQEALALSQAPQTPQAPQAPPPPPLLQHSSFEADDEQSRPQSRFDRHDTISDTSSDYHPHTNYRNYRNHNHNDRPRIVTDLDDDNINPMTTRHRRVSSAAGAGSGSPVPAYPGEDVRPTSPREILGWYMYSFASETYVICAIASFIPILLESLARENGVLLSDRVTPCKASHLSSTSSASSVASASSVSRDLAAASKDDQCIVYVLGIEVNTASFAMYSFSVSVLLQALLVVSISCAADHGNYRKKLLLAFAWTGSIAVMLYLVVTAKTFLFGAFLAVVSNTSFGASFVLLNSFLPLLVRHHPLLRDKSDSDDEDEPRQIQLRDEENEDQDSQAEADVGDDSFDGNDPTEALLSNSRDSDFDDEMGASAHSKPSKEKTSLELSLSTQISSKGIGIGYCAALFVQCVAIFIVFKMHNSIWSLRVVLFVVGAWWGLFTIPAAMWLRPRPGPPLPAAASSSTQTSGVLGYVRSGLAYLIFAWSSLFRTIRLARRLVDIVLFLGGWFLLSDAIATTSSTAVLFAKTQLHMEVWALGMINVISTSTGVIGAFSWAYVSRRFSLKPLHTIMACLALFELIPLYGLSGYLPFVRRWGVGGLQQPWEMYPLAAVYGLVLGGLSSYCRSLYGELIPPGSEAAFYALYAITDKGSSVFGPAIVGAIIDASGEIRPAFFFLAALVGLPAVFLYFVDVDRGKQEGARLAAFIEGFEDQPASLPNSSLPGSAAAGDNSSPQTPRAILAGDDDDEQ